MFSLDRRGTVWVACGLGSCLSPPLLPQGQVAHSPGSQEQDTADSQIGKKHEEPHGRGEGVQEGEIARLAALGGRKDIESTSCVPNPFILQELRGPTSPSAPGPLKPIPSLDARAQPCHPSPVPTETNHVHSVEDTDPQCHEGLGEVDDFLPLSGDGEGCHSQVCFLLEGKQVGGEGGGRETEVGS